MFDNSNKRNMTRSIAEGVHPEITLLLWIMIDSLREKDFELDYLQVFELSIINGNQSICHRQEQPLYKQNTIIELKSAVPVSITIWCIDNGEGQFMMYPLQITNERFLLNYVNKRRQTGIVLFILKFSFLFFIFSFYTDIKTIK